MLIIGELINGMYKQVGKAIAQKDKQVIQRLAKEQVKVGARFLDVNTGPLSKDPVADMKWLVEIIQEVVDVGLCLDSTKLNVIEAGLKLAKNKPMINSINADEEKLNTLIPLAVQHKAGLIGLTMDKKGIPRDRAERLDLAVKLITACTERGFSLEDLYIDPVVLPVNVAQPQAQEVLEAIREIRLLATPNIKTIVGLSNVSQGAKNRGLINRTFLVMACACGLDGAILDPLDKELMDELITAALLLNRQVYCDSYLEAGRGR